MVKNTRIKVGVTLMAGVLGLLGGAHAAAAASARVRYVCDARQNLVVTRTGQTASVQFIDRTYQLRRRPSSIGEKYISNAAALIIDGQSAVFVADDRLQLGQCVEATTIATK